MRDISEKKVKGAGEMAQLLALDIIAEDLDLVLSTHMVAHSHL